MEEDKSNKSVKSLKKKVRGVVNYVDKNSEKVFKILLGGLLLVLLINVVLVTFTNFELSAKAELIKELNKPSKIQLSVIDCRECFDIESVVASVKSKNVEVTEENVFNYDIGEGKELISKYGITKLPSIIIFGEIDNEKIDFNNFELVGDALVFSDVKAPYLDLFLNEVKGQVSVIEILDSSCGDCIPLSYVVDGLAQAGVVISDWQKIEYDSAEGKNLIAKYGIKKVPAVLISEDIDYYQEVSQSLSQLGVQKKDNYYPIHSTIPPYRDLAKNKVVGFVELIMLEDGSCSECYDVEINKQILERFGMNIKSEKIVDVSSSEGKTLISKYDIEKVPIIIMSPDAGEYEALVQVWSGVGTVESDGWFVMRKPEGIGVVRSLTSGQIIGSN